MPSKYQPPPPLSHVRSVDNTPWDPRYLLRLPQLLLKGDGCDDDDEKHGEGGMKKRVEVFRAKFIFVFSSLVSIRPCLCNLL